MLKFVQRWLFMVMLGCYLLAGAFPGPGEWLRGIRLRLPGSGTPLTVSMLLLSVMLFNAGLGVRVADLSAVLRRPLRVALGIAANALLPAVLLPVVALCLRSWPDAGEVEDLLVGLLLVLAMPIAGGAASWGQNAGGNVPLVVTMVLGSTVLSPLTVPLGLRLAGYLVGPGGTGGLDDTAHLHRLAGTGAGTFALVSVVLPCLAGIAARTLIGERRFRDIGPVIKPVSLTAIALLCYINAAGALGQAMSHPDGDLMALAFVASGAVCLLTFLAGRCLARLTRCDRPDDISLTFGTAMNNSSAAAVLAALWFSNRPEVLLSILAYSLLQKTMAGAVSRSTRQGNPTDLARQPAAPQLS